MPVRLFPDIEDMDLAGSLYDLMGAGFGLRPVRAVERLELAEARPSDVRSLGVRRDAPLLLVERIGFAADGDGRRVRARPFPRRPHAARDRIDRGGRVRSSARAVVIGGGVGGCSILYWLTRLGWDDVVLVERADLTSGSTFHSAGLVGQLRSSLALTRMMMSSVELYRTLEAEVGLETGWREVGSLRLASSPERLEEITRQAGWAKTFGLPLELISAGEAQELFPPMSTDGVLGAAYLPSDGYIDPSQLTFALAEGARRRGAEVNTSTRVTGITVERGEVTGVETDRGTIETGIVINAGGMFAKEIGALAGVNVPIIPMAHEYLVLQPSGLPTDMPTMRDPSLLVYFRPESGGLIMGGYERNCAPWSLDGIPADFNGKLLEEDWPRFEELMENAIVRVPSARGNGRRQADQRARGVHARRGVHPRPLRRARLLGRGRLLRSRARGRRRDGAARRRVDRRGDAVARRLAHGLAPLRRRLPLAASTPSRARPRSTRPTTTSSTRATSARPAGRCACRRPTSGSSGSVPRSARSRAGSARTGSSRTRPSATSPCGHVAGPGSCGRRPIGVEHRACREAVAIFDESSFAKIDVGGPGAAAFLESLCANRVARDVGAVTYTQMLNSRGGIECDFTVTRLGEERFRIVTGTAFGQHDLAWIREHAPRDGSVHVADVTSALSCFGVWGPSARALLQPLTTTDLSNEAFPYMRAQELSIGAVPCLAVRVTYVGELGWELYCPAEFGGRLWDTIWAAGAAHGLVAGGYKAIDSLRLEKGYRVWGADITPEDSPFAAGLGFAVKLDKGDFLGREALLARQEPESVLRCLTLDDPRAVALGSEPVRVGDRLVGRVTSGGYGYTVERSIAYAYLPAADAAVGTKVAVEIFGEWVGRRGRGRAALRPGGRARPRLSGFSQPRGRRVATPAAAGRRTGR